MTLFVEPAILCPLILTRLIIIRHGETAWNVEGRFQGQMDSMLTPLGLRQAEALAARLGRCNFTALYSSDLGRTRQTAGAIAENTGRKIILDPRLRERHLGIFQGLTRTEAAQKWPDHFTRYLAKDADYVVPDGESFNQSSARVVGCAEDLARRHAGEQIVLISHGEVLGGILRHVLGIASDAPRRFKRFNAAWNVFFQKEGTWFLETWGDLSHLSSL